MNTTTAFLKRHSLVIGIALMFLLTWPIDLANSGVLSLKVPFIVYIFLGWGFVLASIIMTWLTRGRDDVIALLKRFLIWRVEWRWYLVALLLLPSMQIAAILLNAALSQTPIDFSAVFAYKIFGSSANLVLLVIPFLLFDAIANGEEIGWRGYVLPRLQVKYSALVSSLIVGVIWGFWHLPKFLSHWDTAAFVLFMVGTTAKAVLYTWLYNNTSGSLLLTILFHASGNAGGVFLPVANTVTDDNISLLIIQTLIEITAAVVVTIAAGSARLSRTASKQEQPSGLPDQISKSISARV